MDKNKAQGTHNGYMNIQYFGEKNILSHQRLSASPHQSHMHLTTKHQHDFKHGRLAFPLGETRG